MIDHQSFLQMMNLQQHYNNLYLNKNFLVIFHHNLIIDSFKYFFPDKNFHGLYSSLKITPFNFLSLKILSPIKEIFLIFAFSPREIL